MRSFPCLECRPLFGKPALQFLAGCHSVIVSKNAYRVNIFAYSTAFGRADLLGQDPRVAILRPRDIPVLKKRYPVLESTPVSSTIEANTKIVGVGGQSTRHFENIYVPVPIKP